MAEAIGGESMNAGKARRVAIRILDELEELLDEKNVTIPSNAREGTGLDGAKSCQVRVSA